MSAVVDTYLQYSGVEYNAELRGEGFFHLQVLTSNKN